MIVNDRIHGFRVVQVARVDELDCDVTEFVHEKSGARLLYVAADDENKVFSISFRTPPEDSTGVAHIMEHSVLCGSRKFPLKEPFVELAKGSLNTFLNAMTYPDKTMYPVASVNDKDFRNLMDVYLDAVFYPRVMNDSYIVKQEGWHYELNSLDDELTLKGVVYNEMKGVFSSPDSVLESKIMGLLFPDTTYGIESGGDPEVIPQLTYEGFQEFYRKHYHPSNSYMYLYGKMDLDDQLKFIDEEYLQAFDAQFVDTAIGLQAPFTEGKKDRLPYSVGKAESTEEKTLHSLTYVLPELSREDSWGLRILGHALLTSPAGILKQALVKAGVGKDISGGLDAGIRQPLWNVTVTGSELDKQDAVLDVCVQKLRALVDQGLDKHMIEACLNNLEFQVREANAGNYPIGLAYNIRVMDNWLYDHDPIEALRYEQVLTHLREGLKTRYYEELIEKYILNNTHYALLALYPKQGLQEDMDAALAEELAKRKAAMSKEELETIVKETKILMDRQAAVDSEEALQSIPLLKLDELNVPVPEFERRESEIAGVPVHFVPVNAKGINYVHYYFDLSGLSEEDIAYAGAVTKLMGIIDTKKRDYVSLINETQFYVGDISSTCKHLEIPETRNDFLTMAHIKFSCLHRNLSQTLALVKEVALDTVFTNKERLLELLAERKAGYDADVFRTGHLIASNRVGAQVSEGPKFTEALIIGGMEKVCDALSGDDALDAFIHRLEELVERMFTRKNLQIAFSGTEEEYAEFAAQLADQLPQWPLGVDSDKTLTFTKEYESTGFPVSSKVQYVAKGGNIRDLGKQREGSLSVLLTLLRYEYLWIRVRVQGGAYGAFANSETNGDLVFCSYRDPNLKETLDIYDEMPAYVAELDIDERELRKYIIGTVSNLFTPITPAKRLSYTMSLYFSKLSKEKREQKIRDILNTTVEQLRGWAPVLEAIMKENHIAVMGSEDKLNTLKDSLPTMEQLIK